MSDKPTTTDEEREHGERMAQDMERNDNQDQDEVRASNDPAPQYNEGSSNDPPTYDPIESKDAPDYTEQPSFEEWMRGDGSDD